MFQVNHNDHYNLRKKQHFKLKQIRTKQKEMCLSVQGIKLWDSIPDEIKNSRTVDIFKLRYKYFLINQY